ncbi:MAG: hypothetical protein HRU20_03040 [Pseudomonadales bacterium]|nr:hypothetical protein [Pseudomonadales bacterium]
MEEALQIENNSSAVVRALTIEKGSACPNGGFEIEVGFDQNDNGKLDDNEVDSARTEVLCHGLNGANGQNGTDGINGTDGQNGTNGQNGTGTDGQNGTNGVDGTDGTNAINNMVIADDEPIGENCINGGLKITIGLDVNNNKIIDDSEITNSSYICDGQDGTLSENPCFIVDGNNGQKILDCGAGGTVDMLYQPDFVEFNLSEITGGYRITDSWFASGGQSGESYKSHHYYIDVLETGNVDVSVNIANATDDHLFIYDSLGMLITESFNGDFSDVLAVGTYTIVPTSGVKNIKENFTVDILGPIANIRKVKAHHYTINDTWTSSGGRNSQTLRNHHYAFEVEHHSYLDVSNDTGVNEEFYLIDENGTTTHYSAAFGVNITPGNYTLVVATYNNFKNSAYTLHIVGQFKEDASGDPSFIKDTSMSEIKTGDWQPSGGRNSGSFRNDHYTLDITEDSYIDITIDSSFTGYLSLIDANGFEIVGNGSRLTTPVTAGSYTLVAATNSDLITDSYVLNVVGQFKNLNKRIASTFNIEGSWAPSGGRDIASVKNPNYTFEVSEDGIVDITIEANVTPFSYLVDSLGIVVFNATTKTHFSPEVSAGTYTLVLGTSFADQTSPYRVSINGMITMP